MKLSDILLGTLTLTGALVWLAIICQILFGLYQ